MIRNKILPPVKRLHYDLKSRWVSFGGLFLGSFFTTPTFPDFKTEFEISMEFMPTVWTAHEHSPNIRRDTKRLMTSFAIIDDVIFHGICIGRKGATIKQRVASIEKLAL